MRAVTCWCGEFVAADDDEQLVAALREHIAEAHPDEPRSDESVQARVESNADDAPNRPPWAY
jgi:predicted small metal-binding protein